MKLNNLLLKQSNIHRIPLTGLWQDIFYHVVFVPNGNKYHPFMLFENGNSIELRTDKKKNYSYFDDGDKHVIINIGSPVYFQDGLVNAPKSPAFTSVAAQSKIDPKKLYQSVRNTIHQFYDFYQEEELDLVCAHVIHTYMLGILGKTYYLLLEGEKNTGKSSLQAVMAQLQFNGAFSGKLSMPVLVRKIHTLGATINMDEIDKLNREEKLMAIGVLNSGAYLTGTYEIVNIDAKSGRQILVFYTFGSKTFSANRAILPDSLLSRCVVINTVRNTRPVKSIYGAMEKDMAHFQYLRNQLFAYCLMKGKSIHADILEIQKGLERKGRYGRRSDIFAMVAGVLKHFGGPYKRVLDYLESRESFSEDTSEDDRFYILLNFLIEKCGHNPPSMIEFSNHEFRGHLLKGLEIDETDRFAPTSRSVGSLLKKHRIVEKDSERMRITKGEDKGKYLYRIETVKLLELIERSNFGDLKEAIRKFDFTPSK